MENSKSADTCKEGRNFAVKEKHAKDQGKEANRLLGLSKRTKNTYHTELALRSAASKHVLGWQERRTRGNKNKDLN